MKLLHIGKFYPPYRGGMEAYLYDLATEQVKQGHQVTVLVHNHRWGRWRSETETEVIDGVHLIRIKSTRPYFYTPLMIGLNKQLKKILIDINPDLLHLHWPNPSLFAILLNVTAKKIPWVMSWHSDMVTEHSSVVLKFAYRLIKPFERLLLRNTRKVLVSSQNYLDYSPQLKSHKEITEVVPLGLNTKPLAQFKCNQQQANSHWLEQGFRLYSLGRLTFYKNQAMLIDAMQQLTDCQLMLAGGGQLEKQLSAQIIDNQVGNKVKLLGEVDWQLAHDLFFSCQVFCLASHDRAESFGVVLLEAMYHDKIILVADTPGSGMSWLAKNYNKGFTFKADDVNDFVKQLKNIKQNYNNIIKKPKQFSYDIESITELITTHYQSIIQ